MIIALIPPEMWRWWLKSQKAITHSTSEQVWNYPTERMHVLRRPKNRFFPCNHCSKSSLYNYRSVLARTECESTKERGISFCYLLRTTEELWQDPVKTATVQCSRSLMQYWTVKNQSLHEESLLCPWCDLLNKIQDWQSSKQKIVWYRTERARIQ